MAAESVFRPGARVLVTGATGQDGRLLVPLLQERGCEVHVLVRDRGRARELFGGEVRTHQIDLAAEWDPTALVSVLQPEVLFNLAGQSSVRESFQEPLLSWRVNATTVASLLEAVRRGSPRTRFYQASSSEMFGGVAGEDATHDERSSLSPLSPYAAAKTAAHMLCGVYREAYGVRATCGILFNHESELRPPQFLTAKIAAHVRRLRSGLGGGEPLVVGDLLLRRDWGSAREFARGIMMIADQIAIRSRRSARVIPDEAAQYRDYVLGTARLTSVRELIDTAFRIAGYSLAWTAEADGTAARFGDGAVAVRTDRALYRLTEPGAIRAEPARAAQDLGWHSTETPESWLARMILHVPAASVEQGAPASPGLVAAESAPTTNPAVDVSARLASA